MAKKVKIKDTYMVKGQEIEIELDYYYDEEHDEYYFDEELGNLHLKLLRNEYRRLNNLLTDDEIKSIREKYGLSQKDFAIILGLGEVTITRYESKQIQDKAQDDLIRSAQNVDKLIVLLEKNKNKYIKEYNEEKYNKLINKLENMALRQDNILSGNMIFSSKKFKAVINKILEFKVFLTKTKLAKLLWYVDFLYFKNYGQSITGITYLHLPYGAYPKGFEEILSDKDIEIVYLYSNNSEDFILHIVSCKKTLNLLEQENQIIEQVMNKFAKYNTKELVEYMHKEEAYKSTNAGEIISYEFAKYIIW